MKLTIHAGLHKTGSSSVQVFFNVQRTCIEKSGIYYPKSLCVDGAHHPFAWAVARGDKDIICLHLREWVQTCCERGLNRIFVSSEDLEYLDAEGVKLIKQCAENNNLQIDSIIYIRPQAELVSSQYSQQVREGTYLGTLQEFFEAAIQQAEFLQIERILENYSSVLGSSLMVRFYYDCNHTAINSIVDISQAMCIAGVESYTDPSTYSYNRKLTYEQLTLLRELVKGSPQLQLMNQRLRAKILYNFIESYSWPIDCLAGSKVSLSIEQLAFCKEHFARENKRISEKYLCNPSAIDEWYSNALFNFEEKRAQFRPMAKAIMKLRSSLRLARDRRPFQVNADDLRSAKSALEVLIEDME